MAGECKIVDEYDLGDVEDAGLLWVLWVLEIVFILSIAIIFTFSCGCGLLLGVLYKLPKWSQYIGLILTNSYKNSSNRVGSSLNIITTKQPLSPKANAKNDDQNSYKNHSQDIITFAL